MTESGRRRRSPLHRPPGARSPLALLASAGLVLAFVTACSTSPSPRSTPDPRVAKLEKQVVEWQQRAVMGEVEADRLRREVDRLERELELARRGRPGGSAGPRMTDRNPAAAGELEVGGVEPERGAPIEEIELEEPDPPPAVRSAPSAAGTDGGAEANEGSGAQQLYDQGYALFHQKRYAESEQHFRQVLDRYPSSSLADNALFWIGESRYARGDLSSALAAYSSTLEQFPNGNKASHALYKAGRCLEALGRPSEAAEAYEELKGRFPGTAISDLAGERLQALRP